MLWRNESLGYAKQAGFVGNEPLIDGRSYELAIIIVEVYFDGTELTMLWMMIE